MVSVLHRSLAADADVIFEQLVHIWFLWVRCIIKFQLKVIIKKFFLNVLNILLHLYFYTCKSGVKVYLHLKIKNVFIY